MQRITTYIDAKPEVNTVILRRDIFHTNKFATDKVNESAILGNKSLDNKYVNNRTWVNYTEFARQIREKYPEKKVIISSAKDTENFLSDLDDVRNKMPKIKSSNDIVAYILPKSFEVSKDVIKNMKKPLEKSGIKVLDIDNPSNISTSDVKQANVLVLGGHKDANFENALNNLDAGLIKDKVLALFSCNELGTSNLNTKLKAKGAKHIIFFPSKISENATKAVIKELAELAPSIKDINGNGMNLDELMNLSIDNAMKNKKYQDLIEDFKLLKNFVQQISLIKKNYDNARG